MLGDLGPGGSGNDYLLLPDGTRTAARGTPQYLAAKNGTYTFTLTDAAGTRTLEGAKAEFAEPERDKWTDELDKLSPDALKYKM